MVIHTCRCSPIPPVSAPGGNLRAKKAAERMIERRCLSSLSGCGHGLSYFEPLTEHYAVACLEDFPEFTALVLEDNHKLFLVEQTFGRRFPVRISTFRTPGNDFKGFLSEQPGWQSSSAAASVLIAAGAWPEAPDGATDHA